MRAGLPAAEIRSTFVALLVLLSTLLFFSFYNTEYYWLSLILMYFFMLPKIFTSISHNIRMLDAQITMFSQPTHGIETEHFTRILSAKRVMFSKIRNCLVGYLISMLLINSLVRVLLLWEYAWVSKVADEVVVLVMFTFVSFHLRPSLHVFFTSMDELRPLLTLQSFLQNRLNEEDGGDGESAVEPWDVTKTIAVQWPFKRSKKRLDLTRMPLSLAYEVGYAVEQSAKVEGTKEKGEAEPEE